MSCPEYEMIEHYVLGKLDAGQRAKVEEHARMCTDCAAKLEVAEENEKMLAQLRMFQRECTGDSTSPSSQLLTKDGAQAILGERYDVRDDEVRQGSAGQVFKARDKVLDRLVAVKFLWQKDTSAESGTKAWHEARLMSQLNHPNIAQIHEVGELDYHRFLVMEWVDGRQISEAWRGHPLEQKLSMYLDVLRAVAAAHRRGIVHRDLKPSNILVTSELKPKVLDFGIALETSSLDAVETAVFRGTPAYSAPEQITRPVKICPATDVFALGVLLYQLLTDVLPFSQTQPDELFDAIKNKYPELPTAIAEKTPIALQNICLKALEKEPGKRYQNAQELCDDMNRYLRGERVWATPSFLADKIQQEVFHHRQKLSVWRENQLLTEREQDKLTSIYERIVAPLDPSIIEARELSLSQICLYLGGWVCVLGCSVLCYGAYASIPAFWRPIPAALAALLITILGMRMWNKNESRLAVGFLVASNLLIPLTLLLALARWGVLAPDKHPWGTESLLHLKHLLEVGNLQLFVSAFVCVGFSALLFRITRSSIFVLSSTIALLVLLTVCYLIAGLESWQGDVIAGRYLYPGIGLFAAGILVDRRKFTQYAIPLAVVGLILIVVSLSFIALSENTLFGWIWPRLGASQDISNSWKQDKMGLSFVVNGLFYLGLAGLCQRMGTVLQRRLAQLLNWLGPMHILAVLRILDRDESGMKMIYRVLLPIASFSFVLASVARQMKSFFFSGLAGITTTVHKLTTEHFAEVFVWPVALIATGITWMIVSMLIPRLHAKQRLRVDV